MNKRIPPQNRVWFVFPVGDNPATSLKIVARDEDLVTQEDAEWVAKLLISAREGRPNPGPSSVGEGHVGPAQEEVRNLIYGDASGQVVQCRGIDGGVSL